MGAEGSARVRATRGGDFRKPELAPMTSDSRVVGEFCSNTGRSFRALGGICERRGALRTRPQSRQTRTRECFRPFGSDSASSRYRMGGGEGSPGKVCLIDRREIHPGGLLAVLLEGVAFLASQVWDDYLAGIEDHPEAEAIRQGEGPVAVMNDFARELTTTGYLHNHARMWFAGYWVHVARLPWQLGAKFFQDHLLDFDPASNTLSWRWVAGWQTPGKTYLPRRGNLEKYLDDQLLDPAGLAHLENPSAVKPEGVEKPSVTRESLPQNDLPEQGQVLWIHQEDLNPESSPLADYKPSRVVVTGSLAGQSELQKAWLTKALEETVERVRQHFGVEVEQAESLRKWARKNEEANVVGMRPEVGPLHDTLPEIEETLGGLTLLVRPEDRFLRELATAGFFKFWKKLQAKLKAGEFPL